MSRLIVSAQMVAKVAKVTPRVALNLVSELGVRELTGRVAIERGAFFKGRSPIVARNGKGRQVSKNCDIFRTAIDALSYINASC